MEHFSEPIKIKIFNAIIEQIDFLGTYSKNDDIIGFLNLIWPLKDMPSQDDRFDNAEADIYQHIVNNNDWDYEYLFLTRLEILQHNEYFRKFIEVIVSPDVRKDRGQIVRYVSIINLILIQTSNILVLMNYVDGLPIYLIQTRRQISDRPVDIPPNQVPFFHTKSTSEKVYPHFYLQHNRWDDFHHKTTFGLFYMESKFNSSKIGNVKIMQKDTTVTADALPDTFTALLSDFCSLGQEESYYLLIVSMFPDSYRSILLALRDVALFPKIHEEFENNEIYQTSIVRFNEAEQLARTIRFKLDGYESGDWYKFIYEISTTLFERTIRN